MTETIVLSITSFIGTNIDDIFIDTILFSEAKTKEESKSIICGKYLGIGTLVFLSILGAFGLQLLPQHYIGYLGFVPICLGIKEIIINMKSKENDEENETIRKSTNNIINTALITIANGADNIGVYIPLFAGFMAWQIVVTVCVFLALIAVWCFLGKALADLPVLKRGLKRNKDVIVPVVYIVLGLYILVENFL